MKRIHQHFAASLALGFLLAVFSGCFAQAEPTPEDVGEARSAYIGQFCNIPRLGANGGCSGLAPGTCCVTNSPSMGDGHCRDLNSDVTNCGFCGNICAGGEICVSGVCTVP
jgi:hypothetical protein